MNSPDKQFRIPGDQLKEMIPHMGGCIASDRILMDGAKVAFMYREAPSKSVASGWTFMAGDEDQEYADDASHWAIYEVNTICNYDPAIIPYLDGPIGAAYGRKSGSDEFIAEPMPSDPDDDKGAEQGTGGNAI